MSGVPDHREDAIGELVAEVDKGREPGVPVVIASNRHEKQDDDARVERGRATPDPLGAGEAQETKPRKHGQRHEISGVGITTRGSSAVRRVPRRVKFAGGRPGRRCGTLQQRSEPGHPDHAGARNDRDIPRDHERPEPAVRQLRHQHIEGEG